MLDAIRALRDAFGIQSTVAFVALIALLFALVGAFTGWVVDQAYRNRLADDKAHSEVLVKLHENAERANRLEGELEKAKLENRRLLAAGDARLERLATYLVGAENLERQCIKARASTEIEGPAIEFYNTVSAYLQEEFGSDYAARFKAAMADGGPTDPTGWLGRIRGRKQFLSELIRDMRSRQ